jgi:hypothetical protein
MRLDSMENIFTSRKVQKNNYSGKTGVFWDSVNYRWKSRIKFNSVDRHLGTYKDFEDAVEAREIAETACNILKDLGATDMIVNRSKTAPISVCGIISKYDGKVVTIDVHGSEDDS